jgi:uncharacterized membrane protein
MTGFAVLLIVVAAFIHASWNFLAKRAGGGAAFVWLFGAVSALIYTPIAVALILLQRPHLGSTELIFIVGSAAIHAVYFLMLQRGYRVGDLSLVYPLARGTGPLLSVLAAIAFFAERPSTLALIGSALIIAGVFALATGGTNWRRAIFSNQRAVGYGLLTGGLIACYTLWDKHAVSALLIPPLVLDWGSNFGRTLLVSPYALGHWEEVLAQWKLHRFEAIAVGVLCPLSYILVLTAMVFTPVSYVAPAREISIVFGVLMGAHLLAEEGLRLRLTAAGAMVIGVMALSLG